MKSFFRYGAFCAVCLSLTLVGCGGSSNPDSDSDNRSVENVVYLKTTFPRFTNGVPTSMASSQMYIVNSDGSGKTRVADTGEPVYYVSPKLSQDGSKIVVLSSRDNCGGEGCTVNVQGYPSPLQAWVMNADGNQAKLLTHIRAGSDYDQSVRSPALSRDGSKVVYSDSVGLTVMDVSNMQETKFGSERYVFPYSLPVFSPDGTKIAYGYNGAIYTVNVDGTGKTKIVERGDEPSFSPDGSRITYTGYSSENRSQGFTRGASSIYIVNTDGSGQRRLTSGYYDVNYSPLFSKDGKSIVFKQGITSSYSAPVRFVTINLDGAKQASFDTDGQ